MYRKDGLTYVMVNVLGANGYSFMVTTKFEDIDEMDILDACSDLDLFQDVDDIKCATIETMVSEHDVKFFEGITYNID